MSSKELAIDVIRRLPEEASLLEIAQEIEFVAGIPRGADELDRGEAVSADAVLKLIPAWAKGHAARGVPQIDSDEFNELR